jgi:lipoprotein-anchoring transpeptidase ErfK/SrfK
MSSASSDARLRRTISTLALTAAAVAAIGCAPAQAGFLDFLTRQAPEPAAARQTAPERSSVARRVSTPDAHEMAVRADARKQSVSLLPAAPVGPVTIVVSTDRQRMTVYDGDKAVAETVVSTGVPGHSTPHGVFSVIEKQVFHRSTIYSGAPMPFMQRLTWSGVAMHEGHVTGKPASHGCVRLPAAFAKELYRYTKRGARVVIAREDAAPKSIDVVAPFAPPAARRYVMGEDANAGRLPGEIEMPDQTIGAAKIKTAVDAVGAAPVTALISRKTGMMYVRRAFAPIFEVPVTIDQPNRPLGAHVYVARKTDAASVAWSTVTVSGAVREALNTTTASRGTKSDESAASVAFPSSADEALTRVHLAPGAEQRLNQLLSQGATLIISDETARLRESWAGTNFIAIVD